MNHSMKTLGALALAGLALTSPALAQGPGGRARPTTGAVTAVDTAAMTITVAGANGAPNQTIKLATDTPIAVEGAGTIADVRVGDTVSVSDAAGQVTITDGTLPAAFGFYGRVLTGGGGGGRGGFGGGFGGGGAANAPAFSVTNGRVTAISPLTISAGAAVSVTMSATTGVKVNRITTGQLSGVKVGDQVMAFGQAGADGTIAATAVALNFPQAQGGFGGGRNRGGQGGGFGGGGNGQNGMNAQGGGQGGNGGRRGRRNRGGQGGGQGQPMPGGDMNGAAPAPATDGNNL